MKHIVHFICRAALAQNAYKYRSWIQIARCPAFLYKRVQYVRERAGARFSNDFLLVIQIRWKFRLAVILLLFIWSQQIFAHATTAQLSCHVHNVVAINF